MTVSNITNGEIFTVRLYKRSAGLVWGNNYEVRATQDVPLAQTAIIDLVNRLVQLEAPIHRPEVVIDRAVVSTYARDSRPYNPDAFTSIPVNTPGTNSGGGDSLPVEYCLFVRRSVPTGRVGKLLYRGTLSEAAVTVEGLRAVLAPTFRDAFQSSINTWWGTKWQVGANPFELVMASGDENIQVRVVQALAVSNRIVIKQWGNAYFDRSNPTQ
jgi:uncharacterized protein (DUF3820 family)